MILGCYDLIIHLDSSRPIQEHPYRSPFRRPVRDSDMTDAMFLGLLARYQQKKPVMDLNS